MFVLILDLVEDFYTVEERRLHRIFCGLFFRSSSDTCRRLFPILSAISVSVLWAYIPASIATRSDNVIRLIFSCFPQAVTETIISLIAEVNITLCPLFYPLNVTFTFAINPILCSILLSTQSNKTDIFISKDILC